MDTAEWYPRFYFQPEGPMQQVLFRIPIKIPNLIPDGIPIYGFGTMLFLAFVLCTWLAGRRAAKQGVRKEIIQDLAFWVLIGGIVGARLCSVVLEAARVGRFDFWELFWQFFRIWDGGLILYGSVFGGLAGYVLGYLVVFRKYGVSTWQLADIIAPVVALGLCLGRVGCLLNGCCYGGVATCPVCPGLHFPLSSPPRYALVQEGYQTAAGFTIASPNDEAPALAKVGAVEPGSPAAGVGLLTGDLIVKIRDFPQKGQEEKLNTYNDFDNAISRSPSETRGKNSLALTVKRGDTEVDLPAFQPRTIGLHPTQLYESISMLLLFLLLLAYQPFRKHAGELMALLLVCYGLHRSLNELLRDDARPVGFEKYISLILIAAGLVLWFWLRRLPLPATRSAAAAAGVA